MKTLLIGKIHEDAHQTLKENTTLTNITTEEFTNGFQCSETTSVVLRTFTPLQKEHLDKLPNLQHVVSCSVGINNIDLNELKNRDIKLHHTPGSNANSVAEHTVFMLLSLLRQQAKAPFFELKNKTIGIVGFGHIGKIVAQKLQGFDVKIKAYDIIEQDPQVLQKLNTTMHTMQETLNADIITIHVPLNKHTHKLINQEHFSNMKPNSFFINTSREEVICEDSLIQHNQKFQGIALDVYTEKLKQLTHHNLILTNHVAAQGQDSFKNMCLKPIEQFINHIKE